VIPAPFRVVLDACVLYPFTLRDVLLEAAAAGFYQVCWSETILDEVIRNLVNDERVSEKQAARLAATMQRAFPEAEVTGYEPLIPSMRNHDKDRHVAAAAVKAGAQVIVTANLRDFRDLPDGLEAQSPDEFMCNLFDLDPDRMMGVLVTVSRRLRNPPVDLRHLIAGLNLPEFAELLRAHDAG
jgi:predicted nucleic acid-binding protein